MEKNQDQDRNFLRSGKFCPKCGETITPADLEMFAHCPYCDCRFEDVPELERFILKRMIKGWMVNHFQHFLR